MTLLLRNVIRFYHFRNLFQLPDVTGIVLNCSVGREDPCTCDIVEGHLVPLVTILIAFGNILLCGLVCIEICKYHIWILVFE